MNANDLSVEGITATEYLKFKEMIVDECWYSIRCSLSYLLWFYNFNQKTHQSYLCVNMKCRAKDEYALEIDFGAVDFSTPRLTLSSSIGNGLSYVSKFLTSKLNATSASAQCLVDYLLTLNHQGDVRQQKSNSISKLVNSKKKK